MTKYNTGNPIGSTAVKDLYDNAENLDTLVNDKTKETHPDRLGVPRKTWHGMEQEFQDFLINSGYQNIGDYAAGLNITARNQIFWRDGELYRAGAVLELPYTTTGDWGDEEGLFVAVGDQSLRQELNIYFADLPDGVNDSLILQKAIDETPAYATLDLMGNTYNLTKSETLDYYYPNNDQPCVAVIGKPGITIRNGTLKVNNHGQGALEIRESPGTKVSRLKISGPGNFPPLDGRTGRGEKGDWLSGEGDFSTKPHSDFEGYFDRELHWGAERRNNSVDSSAFSTGGFGGNFPQWGGGTASTWGMWNGGYIGNYGNGVYIQDSMNCDISESDISGFNGAAVSQGGGSSTKVHGNKIHNCYVAGVIAYQAGQLTNSDCLEVFDNDIYDIGHPDASVNDQEIDPGYGTSTSNATNTFVENYRVYNNRIRNCKRKGVDAHHAINADVHNNDIDNCGQGVILSTGATSPVKSMTVRNNKISNIEYPAGGETYGILVSPSSGSERQALLSVTGNLLRNVGVKSSRISSFGDISYVRGIYAQNGLISDVSGNEIFNDGDIYLTQGIHAGDESGSSDVVVINGNTILAPVRFGIYNSAGGGEKSRTISGNAITILENPIVNIAPDQFGLEIGVNPSSSSYGNDVIIRSSGEAYFAQPNNNIGGRVEILIDFTNKTHTLLNSSGISSSLRTESFSVQFSQSPSRVVIQRDVSHPWHKFALASLEGSLGSGITVSARASSSEGTFIHFQSSEGTFIDPNTLTSGAIVVSIGF